VGWVIRWIFWWCWNRCIWSSNPCICIIFEARNGDEEDDEEGINSGLLFSIELQNGRWNLKISKKKW
jgi:hypothetical protein